MVVTIMNGSIFMYVQEWPERIYPTYANGPGYVLSKDIVQFIVWQSANGTLRVLSFALYLVTDLTI